MKYKIIDVNQSNIEKYPQAICFINPKLETFHFKLEWLKKRFKEGLKIKLMFVEGENKSGKDKLIGFVEYLPGNQVWRAVEADGYMFIHCLWTNGKKFQHQGLGNKLLQEVEKDAKGLQGVAVITSDKAFMANKSIFLKNNYQPIEESGTEQLLVKQYKKTALPKLKKPQNVLGKYQDLTIIYSCQCPWIPRFVQEIEPILKKKNLKINIKELTSAKEAQETPGIYSTFNLIYKGHLLADRYISTTRFQNILKKEKII
ncbi:GNAT family N-acetyltransferase [Candidatus Margulisiibacteriota bacterium]